MTVSPDIRPRSPSLALAESAASTSLPREQQPYAQPRPEDLEEPATGRRKKRSSNWVGTAHANIYYRPRLSKKPSSLSVAQFPSPHIASRRSRPQAIHIVSYPAGYVPKELRPERALQTAERPSSSERLWRKKRAQNQNSGHPPPTAATQQPSNPTGRHRDAAAADSRKKSANKTTLSRRRRSESLQDHEYSAPPSLLRPPLLSKLLASFASSKSDSSCTNRRSSSSSSSASDSRPPSSDPVPGANFPAIAPGTCFARPASRPPPPAYDVIRPGSAAQQNQSQSLSSTASVQAQAQQAKPRAAPLGATTSAGPSNALALTTESTSSARSLLSHTPTNNTTTSSTTSHQSSFPIYSSTAPSTTMTMAARVSMPGAPNTGAFNIGHRNSLISVRSAKSAVTSLVTEVPKPVASGSGVTCSILLAEPNIFLSGFDHDGRGHREGQSGTALLRGKLQLRVSKNIKIKAVQLKLLGRARTEWPEGIPPLKQDLFEEESLRTQVLTFFNAMNDGWESEYGNQCTYRLKNDSPNSSTSNLPATGRHNPASSLLSPNVARNGMTAKEMKRLSLQNVQSRSFNKGESPIATATQAKGYKVFYPGVYDYSFELPIDHHQLETTKLQYGSVKWELHATVDRAGAFKPNLHGMKEVSIVRVPDQLSLEMSEPISISRQWEDQLHYDIIISGKSFPIGSKIPIAFKLTPLAKVQVHKLKVFVTESIEYWTNDKRVTRKDPGRKILLLEKTAGKPLDPSWASSDLRTIRGGEFTPDQRRNAREQAARRRAVDAARRHTAVEPLPDVTENILGDLDLGLESFWGSTEIEANVQIPTCEMMAKNKELRLHPDCSWKNVNVYHWIKVVMRISRLDPEDPTGTRRRHFEISIDSPFTVLNCRATQANTNLPAYSGRGCHSTTYQSTCGCPDALTVPTEVSPNSSTGELAGVNLSNENLPAPPQAAHLANEAHMPQPTNDNNNAQGPRPIHLLRVPSFNPPAFEDDIAPPPAPELIQETRPETRVMTPPPNYDVVVGTPSVDGLADYFARLADYGFEDEDSGSENSDETPPRILDRSGRVNVMHPRTPGGRMPSRSLEISRPPINLNMDNIRRRAAGAV